MMCKQLLIVVAIFLGALFFAGNSTAQREQIISKKEVDMFYQMDRSAWEKYAQNLVAPQGTSLHFKQMETGTSYLVEYESGIVLMVQPLYNPDQTLGSLVIGSYYPNSTGIAFDESFRRDIEQKTQRELGSQYTVYAEILDMGNKHRGVEFMVYPAH